MARVTVEDCVEYIPNRFELVVLASQRAKSIVSGSPIAVSRDKDKDTVVALREIAEAKVSPDKLRETLLQDLQEVGSASDADAEISEEVSEEMASLQRGTEGDVDDSMLYTDEVEADD